MDHAGRGHRVDVVAATAATAATTTRRHARRARGRLPAPRRRCCTPAPGGMPAGAPPAGGGVPGRRAARGRRGLSAAAAAGRRRREGRRPRDRDRSTRTRGQGRFAGAAQSRFPEHAVEVVVDRVDGVGRPAEIREGLEALVGNDVRQQHRLGQRLCRPSAVAASTTAAEPTAADSFEIRGSVPAPTRSAADRRPPCSRAAAPCAWVRWLRRRANAALEMVAVTRIVIVSPFERELCPIPPSALLRRPTPSRLPAARGGLASSEAPSMSAHQAAPQRRKAEGRRARRGVQGGWGGWGPHATKNADPRAPSPGC